MNVKSIFASKTFWINLLGGVAATTGTLTGVIPAKYTPAIVATGSIANILLRLVTNQGVSVSGAAT
jgi:hypothetical protein